MKPWWEEYVGLLNAEYEKLREIGAEFSERQDEKARGLLILDLQYKVGDESLALEVRFPDVYPYARPEIYAPALALPHHQNPFDKNLCLIGRRTENWTPQMFLADLLQEQIPKVLEANRRSPEDAGDLEEHQGEPVTAFFNFDPGSVAFVDGAWNPPAGVMAGEARIAIARVGETLRAQVLDLTSNGKTFVAQGLAACVPNAKVVSGRWVQIDPLILDRDPQAFERHLIERVPPLGRRQYPHGVDAILVGFAEEHGHRQLGQGWILLVREKAAARGSLRKDRVRLIGVQRVGDTDYAARVPAFAHLRAKDVTIFGLGCVGAPIALELAKGGVGGIFGVDSDIVDGASTVRWPLGVDTAGVPKVHALGAFIGAHYPHVQFNGAVHRVGTVGGQQQTITDATLLPELFNNSDLIIDATAELGIQRLLSDFALRGGVPYIAAHSTNGAHGGQLVRLQKGTTGCLNCLRWHQFEGTIAEPPFLAGDWSQPAGCAASTFLGASWDLQEVSLAAARLAVGTLMGDGQEWDVAVLAMVDETGRPQPPSWRTFQLRQHPRCVPCLAK